MQTQRVTEMDPVNILLHLLFLSCLFTESTAGGFQCAEKSTCHSLVDYISSTNASLSSIQKLFGVKNLRSILGANNLQIETPPDYIVKEQQVIKIPVPCICFNGTGVSNKMPIYTVQAGDGLSVIAMSVFAGLVTYQRIQAANKIPNADLIDTGQKLWIPLPCSCNDVDGQSVVHYAHLVEEGSTVEQLAQEYGTTSTTLYRLNGISDDRHFIAGTPFDVPLKACNSSVRSDSQDYPLLVANGTYIFTANGCVKCKCDSSNNLTLQCEPSGLRPTNWSTCPEMQCQGAGSSLLSLGNTTASSCGTSTCAYAGFNRNQTIYTTLAPQSTCPAGNPAGGTPANHASRMGLTWNLLASFHLVFLLVYLI